MSSETNSTRSESEEELSQTQFKLLDKNKAIKLYVKLIKSLINENKKILKQYDGENLNIGENYKTFPLPKISIEKYLERIIRFTNLQEDYLVISLILIDRLLQNGLVLTNQNIHRLILISMIEAQKQNDDLVFDNKFYSKVGGISLKDFNKLEYDFLVDLDFNTFVSENEYNSYINFFNQ